MSTDSGLKSLRYAEEELGANKVYEDAQALSLELTEAHNRLDELRDKRRSKEQFKADREMEVIEEERASVPNESVAAFERRLKVVFSNDGGIREAREELSFLAGEINRAEHYIEGLVKDIQITVARMQELGGYFQYLAEIKRSQRIQSNPTRDESDPWQ